MCKFDIYLTSMKAALFHFHFRFDLLKTGAPYGFPTSGTLSANELSEAPCATGITGKKGKARRGEEAVELEPRSEPGAAIADRIGAESN